MKTPGRILIILVVFAIVMGITYVAVNASGLSSSMDMPQFEGGERPVPPSGQFEGRSEGREGGGGGLMFGLIKNVGIIAILVAIIVVPKNIFRRRKLQVASMNSG